MLIVLTGGARSGKSSLALKLAERPGLPVTFVATCPRIDGDTELDQRIGAHRAERPAEWTTVEAEHDLAAALQQVDDTATVVIDCLTLWVSNLLHRGDDAAAIDDAGREVITAIAARAGQTIAVTNEVGLGIVPADPLSRAYRDALGQMNQAWVAAADRALFLVAGKAIALRDPDELLP
ncbi:MAG: bifunctional adenosylcobinamide kinase/adenosylcobinamide-phosphate guanylyltransferase [Acidimicrobiales bacterium]